MIATPLQNRKINPPNKDRVPEMGARYRGSVLGFFLHRLVTAGVKAFKLQNRYVKH